MSSTIQPQILPPPPLDAIARDVLGLKRRLGTGDAHTVAEIGDRIAKALEYFEAEGSHAAYRRFLKEHVGLDEESARRFMAVARLRLRDTVLLCEFADPARLFRLAALPPAAFDHLVFDRPYVIPGTDSAKLLGQMSAAELDIVLDRLESRALPEPSSVHEARSLTSRVSTLLAQRSLLPPETQDELDGSVSRWTETHAITPKFPGPADTQESVVGRTIDQLDAVAVALSVLARVPGRATPESLRRVRERVQAVARLVHESLRGGSASTRSPRAPRKTNGRRGVAPPPGKSRRKRRP